MVRQVLAAEDASGNYMFYGVREFGMSAIMNGVALHGGFVPYGATFLIFMEYARNAVRMSALIFSRQNLPHQPRDAQQLADIARGGYVLKDCAGEPELIIISTGSEIGLAVQGYEALTAQGRKVRVVSMPCTSVFDAQDAGYKQAVLPLQVSARIAIEAAHADYWYKYVGLEGRIIGMTSFGESAPAPALFEAFGFTLDNVLETAAELLDA